MTNRTKTRINADGEVVRVSDDESTSSSSVLRSGSTLDVFGFNLEWRQFLLVLGVLSLMIGLRGSEYSQFPTALPECWILSYRFFIR
jgi:hypothetical protein